MNNKIVTIFGGTGFVGRHLIAELIDHGYVIKIPTRDKEKADKIKTQTVPGRINVIETNIYNTQDLTNAISGSNIVINLIASFDENDKSQFNYIHSQFPEKIAKIASKCGVEKFIHMSNLGIDHISTIFAKTRLLGEKTVKLNFEKSIILRSGLIIGRDDDFLRVLYMMAQKFYILPMPGDGKMK